MSQQTKAKPRLNAKKLCQELIHLIYPTMSVAYIAFQSFIKKKKTCKFGSLMRFRLKTKDNIPLVTVIPALVF